MVVDELKYYFILYKIQFYYMFFLLGDTDTKWDIQTTLTKNNTIFYAHNAIDILTYNELHNWNDIKKRHTWWYTREIKEEHTRNYILFCVYLCIFV